MFLWTFLIVGFSTLLACGASMSAVHFGLPQLPTIFAAIAIGLIGPGYFLMRWWLGRARAAGIPLLVHSKANMIRYFAAAVSLIVVAILLESRIFDASHDRLAQGAFSLFVVAPLAFLLARSSFAHMRAPKPQEAKSLAVSAVLYCILPVIFAANLALQIHARPDPDLEWLRRLDIDGYFVLIPILPLVAYFMFARSLSARRPSPSLDRAT
jgi:hypothetical protein